MMQVWAWTVDGTGCMLDLAKPIGVGQMHRSSLAIGFALLSAAACAPDSSSRLVAPSSPSKITNGSFDAANTYANVGAFIVKRTSDGQVFPVCSGTLIAPTVFLTAGHCTAFVATLPQSDFSAGVSFGNPIAWGSKTDPQAKVIAAISVITNPELNQRQSDPADLGVLIVSSNDTQGIAAATLPTAGLLDQLKDGHALKNAVFTAVGYGEQGRLVGGGPPVFLDQNPEPRLFAFSSFNALDPGYLRLSQNPSTGSGGTCFGDSGGPNFVQIGGSLVLAATTVTGDPNCRATNVDYRLDTQTARRFLGQFVTLP